MSTAEDDLEGLPDLIPAPKVGGVPVVVPTAKTAVVSNDEIRLSFKARDFRACLALVTDASIRVHKDGVDIVRLMSSQIVRN